MPSLSFFVTCVHISIIFFIACNATEPKISPKFPAIFVFGDSSVDTGNNNYTITGPSGNHLPYGKDFPGHIPTGRFSNGKLAPDFLASMLGIKETVPPFLDPNLSKYDLQTGVNFASSGSGFDNLTTIASRGISMFKQVDLLKKYIVRLKGIVGEKEAKKIISGSLYFTSAGTNDFLIFYDTPTRRFQFNVSGYQDFILNRAQIFYKQLYDLGCRKMMVVGLPPMGCLPIQITLKYPKPINRKCIEHLNADSQSYNLKLVNLLSKLQAVLPGSKFAYADINQRVINMINNPQKYGFVETSKGCCGTGYVEVGNSCNSLTPTCERDSQYLFFDCIHPSEATNHYISKNIVKQDIPKLL
ncbi:GDSL esterase/lipase At1g06990 [Quercus suber]|uniref:GDSL esterase/lipase At1g06990 n=1 Tax=Quercus suber TaxID=58331 RepID=UPI0032DFD8F4